MKKSMIHKRRVYLKKRMAEFLLQELNRAIIEEILKQGMKENLFSRNLCKLLQTLPKKDVIEYLEGYLREMCND